MYTTPGFTDEKIHLFLASNLASGKAALEHDEFLEVVKVPLVNALAMIRTGEVRDAKTVVGLLLVADRLGSQP